MSAIDCADLLDIARGRLAPQSDKATGRNILQPISRILFVDFKQTLNKEEFRQTVYDFDIQRTVHRDIFL